MSLRSKVAIITGAGQGIGRAYALRFAQEDARVVVADIQQEKARSVAQEIADTSGEGLAVEVDVSDPGSVRRMVEQAVERFSQVDVLVNNAAIFSTIKLKPFEEITLEEWNRLMDVNLAGPFLCCQAVAPYMRERKHGRIINISSNAVLSGLPNYTHYVTSKAGIIGLTRSLANELGGDEITVNTVIPGFTETEIPRETVSPEQAEAMVERQAIKRRENTQDLVGAVVFLASEDAKFITGQIVNVDGGLNFT